MKWDYATVIHWGLDQVGSDGLYYYQKELVEIAKRLGCDIEIGKPKNGYQVAYSLTRAGQEIATLDTAGTGGATGSTMINSASTADQVYPLIQELYPKQHAVSRLDAAHDVAYPGAWNELEGLITAVCTAFKVSMVPYGEGHRRPDGTRDATKGRTWYCGSPKSAFRIVLYEKGLEQLAKGVSADPDWVRLEVRVRPQSKHKLEVGRRNLKPEDLFGFSRWGVAVGEGLGHQTDRVIIGSVWKPNEVEQLALKIVRMFDNGIERLLEFVSPEEFGQIIVRAHAEHRQAKQLVKEHTA
mgnify:CR=1 FL=1